MHDAAEHPAEIVEIVEIVFLVLVVWSYSAGYPTQKKIRTVGVIDSGSEKLVATDVVILKPNVVVSDLSHLGHLLPCDVLHCLSSTPSTALYEFLTTAREKTSNG